MFRHVDLVSFLVNYSMILLSIFVRCSSERVMTDFPMTYSTSNAT